MKYPREVQRRPWFGCLQHHSHESRCIRRQEALDGESAERMTETQIIACSYACQHRSTCKPSESTLDAVMRLPDRKRRMHTAWQISVMCLVPNLIQLGNHLDIGAAQTHVATPERHTPPKQNERSADAPCNSRPKLERCLLCSVVERRRPAKNHCTSFSSDN